MFKKYNLVLAAVAVGFFASFASATPSTITFEGFGDLNLPGFEDQEIPQVQIDGVTVRFLTEDANGQYIPTLADVGGARVGFQSTQGDDTPVNDDGSIFTEGGDFSLTDGIRRTRDYIMIFSHPVSALSLNLYDFRADGPHALGNPGSDTVVLELYNSTDELIGSDSYTVPAIRPRDGNVVTLGSDTAGVSWARVNFQSTDGGTAIDNVTFTVPEPSSLGLVSFGLVGLLGLRRRRKSA